MQPTGRLHLSRFLAPGAIRVHPLFRALCRGANASVVVPGRLSLLLGYPSQFHFKQFACTGHPFTCALAPLAPHIYALRIRFGGPKSQRVGSSRKSTRASATVTNLLEGANPNTEFSISEPFSRYGPKLHRSACKSTNANILGTAQRKVKCKMSFGIPGS